MSRQLLQLLDATIGLTVMELILSNPIAIEQLTWAAAEQHLTLLDAATLPRWRVRVRRLRRRTRRRIVLLVRVLRWSRRDRHQAKVALVLALGRWPA